MLVVDTSAVLAALLNPSHPVRAVLVDDGDLHSPHLLDVEFAHALARLVRRQLLTDEQADGVRRDFDDLLIVRYPHQPMADRIWELRHNLSAYDAAFVALAELLTAPLVTCDEKLAGAPGHDASVMLVRTKR
jgi:predicted nucleic acid-binding protein